MPKSPLASFHPLVQRWFKETLGTPSDPQKKGWPAIAGGDDTLILAPTGTGKTLAAFLWELNQLIVEGLQAPLGNSVHILYVSPLKALNNDVQRNLELPLTQLSERFSDAGEIFPEIRVAVRTGDTPASARARMLRKAPHILITTPESLHIMLTSLRGRGMLRSVRAVIVDEIHAIAGTKRGAHLALTLERLDALNEHRPQRIGLSATQRPLEEIARFLSGVQESSQGIGQRTSRASALRASDARGFSTAIVDCGLVKKMEITVESPVEDLNRIPGGTIWPAVTPLLLKHIREWRTTLVFVNNRAQAEKVAIRLNTLAGEEIALPYHGSLSRERRLYLEKLLKSGGVRALIATSSLELGIDIGTVDLVIQVQSPKRVSSGLQRVGRAGHSLGVVSRGILIPTFRDDVVESVALGAAMREGDVEPTTVVQNALDVLAQVVVAAVAVDDDWTRDSLFRVVRRAYPYHRLTDAAFDEVLEMLSGKYPADISAELDARITWDRVSGRLSAPNSSRMVAVISGGTIPDRGLYTVNLPDRTRIGELDEEFVHETRIGDVFQLGSSTWKVQSIEHDRVIVLPAPGLPARMPFWHGEYMSRSPHVAHRVGELRRKALKAEDPKAIAALAKEYESDVAAMRSVVNYVREQRGATGIVPDDEKLVIEQFRDETGSRRVVVHSPFGGRVNAPWGMALANRVREHLTGAKALRSAQDDRGIFEIQVQTSDDGIMLRLPSLSKPLPLDVIKSLTPDEARRRVLDEIGASSLFGARFRMNAARALLLPRDPRRRMPLWLQRLKSLDLLQSVKEHPSFPILVETYRDVLTDAFDMDALARVLTRVGKEEVPLHAVETMVGSPFASTLQFGFVMDWMYGDDAPRAEQRAALLSLDQALLAEVMGDEGADAETIAALEELLTRRRGTATGSRARSADELSVLIDRAGDLTSEEVDARVASIEEGRKPMTDPKGALIASGRLVSIEIPTATGKERRFVLTENLPRYISALGNDVLRSLESAEAVPEGFRRGTLTEDAARVELLNRLMLLGGALSLEDVRARYDFSAKAIERRFEHWRKVGRVVRGKFGVQDGPDRWVSRRLLEIARRRELAKARKQIQAVDLQAYARFVEHWQHVDRSAADEAEIMATVRQLYGTARSSEWWTRDAVRARGAMGMTDVMTRLANSGELVWIVDPPSDAPNGNIKSVRVLKRGTGRAWLSPETTPDLSPDATAVASLLKSNGASFFDDLLAASTLPSRKLRDALRELVAAGLVSSDSFDSLRLVSRWRAIPPDLGSKAPDPARWIPTRDPARERPVIQRRGVVRRLPKWRRPDLEGSDPEHWPGRWSLVRTPGVLGPAMAEQAMAEMIARQLLDRYGIISREHWRRERPAVAWRPIYLELRRLELRGEVRRGYFVEGLSGVQFAKPEAVDMLRAAPTADAPVIVLAASDPANVQNLPLPPERRDSFARVHGRGWVATIAGRVVLVAESRGKTIRVRPDASETDVARAAKAIADRLVRRGSRPRDVIVEMIDQQVAARSPHYPAFAEAGFRRTTRAIRYYAPV
ncbi:MAG TPA: DEAD/DEAH box helicase [Gemmatimonadaceae bacterium]